MRICPYTSTLVVMEPFFHFSYNYIERSIESTTNFAHNEITLKRIKLVMQGYTVFASNMPMEDECLIPYFPRVYLTREVLLVFWSNWMIKMSFTSI